MSVFLSNAYILSAAGIAEAWKPRLCWHNLVTVDTVAADYEDASYPASNLANPATNLLWKSGDASAQNLTCLFSYNDDIDYVGVARHNFGTGGCSVIVEGLDPGGDPEDNGDWSELVAEQLLGDDKVAIFIFVPGTYDGVRLVLAPDTVEPQCGVFQVGKSIQLPYGMPVGYIPITKARTSVRRVNLTSSGDYPGVVEQAAFLRGTIDQKFLDPGWYYANLDAFQQACATETFFFAWDPEGYPDQAAYCWVENDPQPRISKTNGEIDITFEVGALVI